MPGSSDSTRAGLLSYSTCIAAAVSGPPQRGLVHSAFQSASNIIFPDGFLLSLNTATSPRVPNGIQLTANMPVSHLRVGMPVLLGVHRLSIQPLDYTLDLSYAIQWNPYIERPAALDMDVLSKNIAWLRRNVASRWDMTMVERMASLIEMVRSLCGRGPGLTPSGDDMLAGWMAIGWLLNGPQHDFLSMCQQIVAVARQQTHLLSQCWLDYAANGYVAEPIKTLLHALTQEDEQCLVQSTQAVLAMGATSGQDVIQGILMATSEL